MVQSTQDPLAALVARLDVVDIGGDIFESRTEDDEGRAFGGELLAQAVVAAGRTAGDRVLHSLHAYFLRPGKPGAPVRLRVERLRDGRTFASRRVAVEQDGRVVTDVTLSFTLSSPGTSYQDPMPDVPQPESLPTGEELAIAQGWPPPPEFPSDWRHVDEFWRPLREGEPPLSRTWMRPLGDLPDDPITHAAMLIYYTDSGSFGAMERRFGEFDWRRSASLDHSVWLHNSVRWDDWILHMVENPVASSGRALSHGKIFARTGQHILSFAQEAIFRPKNDPTA